MESVKILHKTIRVNVSFQCPHCDSTQGIEYEGSPWRMAQNDRKQVTCYKCKKISVIDYDTLLSTKGIYEKITSK